MASCARSTVRTARPTAARRSSARRSAPPSARASPGRRLLWWLVALRGAGALRVPFARLPRPPARRDAASALDARVPAPVSLPEVVGDRSPAGGAAAEAERAARAAAPVLGGSSGAASVARSVARHAWTTAPRNARLQIVASVACLVAAKALTVSVPFLLQGCVDGLVALALGRAEVVPQVRGDGARRVGLVPQPRRLDEARRAPALGLVGEALHLALELGELWVP